MDGEAREVDGAWPTREPSSRPVLPRRVIVLPGLEPAVSIAGIWKLHAPKRVPDAKTAVDPSPTGTPYQKSRAGSANNGSRSLCCAVPAWLRARARADMDRPPAHQASHRASEN